MPELVAPTPRLQAGLLALWDELLAHGEDADAWLNWGDDNTREDLADPEAFAAWAAAIVAQETTPDEELPPDRVRNTVLWWVDGDEVLGRISIRHDLTPHLFEIGGHIGYMIAPHVRRRGHATALLRDALPVAAAHGITRALITCDDDNVASAKVIEANGGLLDDVRHGKRRYWVPTRP